MNGKQESMQIIMCMSLVSDYCNNLHSLLSGVLIVMDCSENGPIPALFTAATEKEYSVKGINSWTV